VSSNKPTLHILGTVATIAPGVSTAKLFTAKEDAIGSLLPSSEKPPIILHSPVAMSATISFLSPSCIRSHFYLGLLPENSSRKFKYKSVALFSEVPQLYRHEPHGPDHGHGPDHSHGLDHDRSPKTAAESCAEATVAS
ncbi:hypothetical protein STEG23_023709, partial [Scotinomys teguina]